MDALLSFIAAFQLVFLFILSRQSIKKLFQFFRMFFKSDRIVFSLISIVFLPGTIIHELSHFIMATLLFLKVRDIHIFPQWKGNYIKLGSVHYEKKDVVRSIIVGLAPIFVGVLFFWWMSTLSVLAIENRAVQIASIYLIFIISTSMFSSKQDLVDIIYLIPIIIIAIGIVYIFDIDLRALFDDKVLLEAVNRFLYSVNIYLLLSLVIHVIIIGSISLILFVRKKI